MKAGEIMSHPIYDCGQEHKELGEMLNYFLYKDGKPNPNTKIEHTYEDLWDMLETIRVNAWASYDDIASYMGWKS